MIFNQKLVKNKQSICPVRHASVLNTSIHPSMLACIHTSIILNNLSSAGSQGAGSDSRWRFVNGGMNGWFHQMWDSNSSTDRDKQPFTLTFSPKHNLKLPNLEIKGFKKRKPPTPSSAVKNTKTPETKETDCYNWERNGIKAVRS